MITIIDDDAGARDSLRVLLQCAGLDARTFASCDDFVAAGAGDEEDCLILDIQMRGMTGLELLEHLRQRGNDLPVILVSARPPRDVVARAEKAGAIALLSKPFKAVELLGLIRNVLERRTPELC
ncbi:MAG: response regulator [Alphaproteobacteria bacterium]|nr:response regulator [Alphaproteobacteria bacterium]